MLRIKFLLVALLTLVSVGSIQAAEIIYKWKDSKGNIKYTQSKPPAGIDYITIQNRSSKSTTAKAPKTNGDEAIVSEEDKIIKAQNTEKNRVDALNEQRAAKNCTIAKNNLEALERSTRIQIQEEGKKRLLSAEERNNRLKTAKENITKYCK